MVTYLMGVLAAFAEPVLHGGCNIVDRFLSVKVLPRLSTLVLISSTIALVCTAITVFIFDAPHMLSLPLLGIALLLAASAVCYLFPYYWALGEIDTSIVAALFSLGKVFIPVFAFFFLGERLGVLQYAGFALIIGSSIALSFEPGKFKVNKAFYWILSISLMFAVEMLLYKYAFLQPGVNWGSLAFTIAIFQFLIALVIFLASGAVQTIRKDYAAVRHAGWLVILSEVFAWGGSAGNTVSLTVLPVTVSSAIQGTQPIFVLLYAYLFKNRYPDFFREETARHDIIKKGVLFLLTIIGSVLVVAFGGAGA